MELSADERPRVHALAALATVWVTWFAAIIGQSIIHNIGGPTSSLAPFIALAHFGVASISTLSMIGGSTGLLIFGALTVRICAMLVDVYELSELPFMGGSDAAGFYIAAVNISSDLGLAGDTYGGTYTALVGYLFHYAGPETITAQYFNVLFGTSAVALFALVLLKLEISRRTRIVVLAIAAFLPTAVIYSGVLLREAVVQFLITASLVCILEGLKRGKYTGVFAAAGLVLLASTFHAGVVGVLIGYSLVAAVTYRDPEGRLSFGARNLVPATPLVLGIVVIVSQSPDLFLAKFSTLDSEAGLLHSANRRGGGSAYLTGLQIDSWPEFVMYAPVRALYFLGAPMPFDWRGLGDVLAFALDSAVYLVAFIAPLWIRFGAGSLRTLRTSLWIVSSFAVVIFGAGVSNAGTAMRHRTKLVMLLLTVLALALDQRRRNRESSLERTAEPRRPTHRSS